MLCGILIKLPETLPIGEEYQLAGKLHRITGVDINKGYWGEIRYISHNILKQIQKLFMERVELLLEKLNNANRWITLWKFFIVRHKILIVSVICGISNYYNELNIRPHGHTLSSLGICNEQHLGATTSKFLFMILLKRKLFGQFLILLNWKRFTNFLIEMSVVYICYISTRTLTKKSNRFSG